MNDMADAEPQTDPRDETPLVSAEDLDTGTPYAKIIPGTTRTVDILWTAVGKKPGVFEFEEGAKGVNTKILLNMKETSLYQTGIPGIAHDVDSLVDWVRTKIKLFAPHHVRSIGHSAGASAAIGFGNGLNVDTVIAIGPELELGVPGYRSYERSASKTYDAKTRNLRHAAALLGERLTLVFPAYDTSDYRHIFSAINAGRKNTLYVGEMHSGKRSINWRNVLNAPGPVKPNRLLLDGQYEFKLEKEDVWRVVTAYESIGKADAFAAELLEKVMEIDSNPGIMYRLSVQKAILGDMAAAADLWQWAFANCNALTPGLFASEYRWKLKPALFKNLTKFYVDLHKAFISDEAYVAPAADSDSEA